MKALIEIGCTNPDLVLRSLKPDIDENEKFKVNIKANNNKILLEVESKEIGGLLAGINSYVKLIRTALNALEG